MPNCKSCGAKINFITTPTGRKTPIETTVKTIWTIEGGEAKLIHGYESHFANCPNADQHRKPKIQNQKIGPLQNREGG